MKNLAFFYFCGSFLPSWIRIRIRNLNADPDPDPATQINADPCGSGSGSETLEKIPLFQKRKMLTNTQLMYSNQYVNVCYSHEIRCVVDTYWMSIHERRFNALRWLALEEKCKNWLVFMRPPHLAGALHIWTRPQLCTETGDPARLPAQRVGRRGQRNWNIVRWGEKIYWAD